MTPYEEHLLMRKQLRQSRIIANCIVVIILFAVGVIDYLRFIGG